MHQCDWKVQIILNISSFINRETENEVYKYEDARSTSSLSESNGTRQN